jgi:hypothetical protein
VDGVLQIENVFVGRMNLPSRLAKILDKFMFGEGCFQGTGDSLEKCSECTKCTVFIKNCKIMSGK